MRFSIFIFLLICSTCFQVSLSQEDDTILLRDGRRPRITNGHLAEVGQFPYIVLIKYGGSAECTGSIIHKDWILTAAHCCRPSSVRSAEVVVGTINPDEGKSYFVKEIIANPKFIVIPEEENNGTEYVIDDVGLLHLETSIEFNENVSPITLATKNVDYDNKDYASIAGYGRDYIYGDYPLDLHYAMVHVLSQDQCRVDWPYASYVNHLCTSTSQQQSVCYGDSGGPVVYRGVQVGVVCTADTYCQSEKANLHTHVPHYIGWIEEQLAKSGDHL